MMPNDRGTLPRGALPRGPLTRGAQTRGTQTGAEQPPAWPGPTGPAGRRLPAVPRERKPALAALALLLIAGGALAAGFLVLSSGRRVAAIEISQPVGAGERIPVGAMQEVQIASGTGLPYVPWTEASQVARYYARNVIQPGTLLTSAMVAASGNPTSGKDVLGLALKDGQFPDGLQVGDHVEVYQVSQSQESCPGGPGLPLATNAVVLAIAGPSAATGSGATDVTVALAPADAGAVACNAANGIVGLAVLPTTGAATSTSAGTATQPAPVPSVAASVPASPPAGTRAGSRKHATATPSPSGRA